MIRQPMLAAKSSDSDLQRLSYPVLASPKIDGIRGVVVNGALMSRSMKPIRNTYTQDKFGHLNGLDGELVVGNPYDSNLMQQTSSGVMSISGQPDVRFFVFDNWELYVRNKLPYRTRYERLQEYFSINYHDRVVLLPHELIGSYSELLDYEKDQLEKGYEGVMVRGLRGDYKTGRSTLREQGLLKVKRFTDDEAVVVGYEPLMRNNNELELDERGYAKRSHSIVGKVADDMLGNLLVVGADPSIRFSIGSGFTEAERRNYWTNRESLVGMIVKYKHFAVTGVKEAPRMPIFLGFRDRDDT